MNPVLGFLAFLGCMAGVVVFLLRLPRFSACITLGLSWWLLLSAMRDGDAAGMVSAFSFFIAAMVSALAVFTFHRPLRVP